MKREKKTLDPLGRLSASLLACVSLRSLKYSYCLFDTWIDGRNEKFYNEVS